MSPALRLVLFAAGFTLSFAVPASAQYMYLDSNANGVHDAGDRMNPNGTATTVDLYVLTNQNRDGSTAVCDTGPELLSINQYQINLLAVGGVVTYAGFVNQQTSMPTSFGELNPDGVVYKNGFGGGTQLTPGTYRLCTLTITGVSGTPRIDIVDLVTGSQDFTGFGTDCLGRGFDNVYRLDGPNVPPATGDVGDFTDADGLAQIAGGNTPPTVTDPGNKTVNELALLAFTVTATDPDAGQAITFSLDAGAPTGAAINATSGAFSWTPTEAQGPGVFPITIRATDNATVPASGTADITVTVNELNLAPVLASIGNQSVTVNTLLSFTATATDADLPPNLKFFSLEIGSPPGATISTSTGVFNWTPTATGSFPVTVTVNDNGTPSLSDFEGITITVSAGANQPPVVANPGNRTVNELVNLAFTATATDPNAGDVQTWSLTLGTPAATGATINPSTAAFSWTPTEAQGPGVYPVTITATDNGSPPLSGSAAITITVTEVNVAPVVTNPGNRTTAELVNLAFTVTATDADVPANTIARSLTLGTPAATGATIGSGTGAFSWTPTEPQGPGVYPVTIVATDNGTPALSGSAAITITVTEVNVAPALAVIGNKTGTVGTPVTFTATATDADLPANTLTFSLDAGAPAGATITGSTGAFSWTPTASGSFPVTIRVTDNGTPALNDFEAISIVVGSNNQPPVVASPGNRSVNEVVNLAFTATATDPNAGDVQTWSLTLGTPAATGATIGAGTGAFSWTPTEPQGPGVYPVTITATDNGSPALSGSAAITITVTEVNVAPVLAPIGNKAGTAATPVTFTATATDEDLPANTLTFSLDAGAPAGSTIGALTGAFSWTPTASGTFPVTVRVTDNGTPALNDFEAISIVVGGGNQPPVVANPGNRTVNELVNLAFTATATDPNSGDVQTWSLTLGTPAATGATINPSTGAFSWTPTEAQGPGVYPVTITATDNGTPPLSGSAAITIAVNEVNVAPVLAPIGNKTGTVGTPVTFTATATDEDLPANTLTFSLDAGAPAGATINGSTGAFSWTPTGSGSFPVTVRVTDSGSPALSDFEVISIAVGVNNQAPALGAIGNRSVNELATLAFTATATDPNAGDVLTFSLDAGAPAGATIGASTGAFSWTPTETQGPGLYPITVRVRDNGTPQLDDFETIQVTVNEVNVAPVLAPIGNKSGTVGVAVTFTATATDNDIPANELAFSLDAGAPAGATITAGAFSWTPSATGSFPVTVRVTDDGTQALSDFEAITITVAGEAENQAPVLAAIGNKTVGELTLLSFTATATDADPGQTLTFSLDAGSPSGAAITAGGVFSWTPNEAQGPGSYPATIRVTDNGTPALNDFEAITITVREVNVAPVLAAIGNKSGTVGVAVTFTASATDADVPANALAFSLDAGAPAGATINATTGAFSWTPSATGTFSVTVRVTDDGTPSLSDSETIEITVSDAGGECLAANAFFFGRNLVTVIGFGERPTCVQIEPVNNSYSNRDVDLSSIVMKYAGKEIMVGCDDDQGGWKYDGRRAAVNDDDGDDDGDDGDDDCKGARLDGDKNDNGVREIRACFTVKDLRFLFADLPRGLHRVEVSIEGNLASGARFCDTVKHSVLVLGDRCRLVANPNPLNPETVLNFTTTQAGPVTVRIFDISGRLVKTLHDGTMPAGFNSIRWNGSADNGNRVATGIYFVKMLSLDGEERLRVTVLK